MLISECDMMQLWVAGEWPMIQKGSGCCLFSSLSLESERTSERMRKFGQEVRSSSAFGFCRLRRLLSHRRRRLEMFARTDRRRNVSLLLSVSRRLLSVRAAAAAAGL